MFGGRVRIETCDGAGTEPPMTSSALSSRRTAPHRTATLFTSRYFITSPTTRSVSQNTATRHHHTLPTHSKLLTLLRALFVLGLCNPGVQRGKIDPFNVTGLPMKPFDVSTRLPAAVHVETRKAIDKHCTFDTGRYFTLSTASESITLMLI